ncbi:atypical protein kinase C-like isoform X1 [Zootermopsis nevadensis]|uniref:Protein kinase C iota type n=1 Tax=Zootermopsis nevadensis TaxID=136037 RepID=A0A067RNN0_ZOONE|nr:atypical protein kinase C-like isoform X1 [Zootermopsis nevadensis]XP_021916334.1 atypical protein kinase C-like isoform X1 [Zootermopsis nevadensis]KDR21349.1 Protein kinase C iota type [Zootermopsis nevadensis]
MPTQLSADAEVPEIRVKTAYNEKVMITYVDPHVTVEQLCQEMRDICCFPPDQVFTMKWVDEEGDPCTISTQMELDEAIRLYEVNRDSELTIHEYRRRASRFWYEKELHTSHTSVSPTLLKKKVVGKGEKYENSAHS